MKTEHDLPTQKRSIYLKALSALEMKNPALVVQLLQPLVIEEPEFLVGRRLLREAQILRSRGKSSFFGISGTGISLGRGKIKKLLESGDWKAAIEIAEKALDADPLGVAPNKDLFEAASTASKAERNFIYETYVKHGGEKVESDKKRPRLAEQIEFILKNAPNDAETAKSVHAARDRMQTFDAIARLALETIAHDPKNANQAKHDLGDYLLATEDYDEAFKIFEEILHKNPADLDARDKSREAAARRSMQRGRLETASFADLVKQRQSAGADEKVVTAAESAEDLARIVYEAHEAGNPDREAARKLADLYFNREDYGNAVEYYRYLSALANETDPGLLRKISDSQARMLSKTIADKEKQLEASGLDEAAAAQAKTELDQLRRDRAELMLGEAQRRVDRNPTDLQYRFELGEQLVIAGHYKEAIPELQKARSNPNTRTKALNLLGKCYTERSMLDLAAKTLADAASEIPGMDGTKKDIIYNLGLVYERMGDKEKSLDCMKQIYEVDYGYLDVAERVEASYTA
ncbi:MAG: tetratricopeptide repeat protein [Chthoniobacterales bacterium]|nr:tetratricopeptide repeat protein [Chthoniobacterales bacterium]